MEYELNPAVRRRILKFQQDEITGHVLYRAIAERQKDEKNKAALLEISDAEHDHYEIWRGYTGQEVKPNRWRVWCGKACGRLLGDTFTIKFMESGEEFGIRELEGIEKEIPEARHIIDQEKDHESSLMKMVDEERLHYVGAIVLGLNDALVELTGTIAGLTFALANTRLVALSAIVTGASATLSMAASNYLAERAEGNEHALKSSLYTGMAYLITVALMVLPYLLVPNELYVAAFGIMLAVVVLVIFLFNFYVSVAQGKPLMSRFLQMAAISLGVAGISYVIGILAKALLGIDV